MFIFYTLHRLISVKAQKSTFSGIVPRAQWSLAVF